MIRQEILGEKIDTGNNPNHTNTVWFGLFPVSQQTKIGEKLFKFLWDSNDLVADGQTS